MGRDTRSNTSNACFKKYLRNGRRYKETPVFLRLMFLYERFFLNIFQTKLSDKNVIKLKEYT